MQIDIPAHIEKLLFLHDTLTIPGFGTFTATKTQAVADYVGGTVTPPSKTLTFSENITTDDGFLVSDIATVHGISTEEAQQAVAEFVEKTQGLLNQREIVTLPSVGRLYKNYVQKIQFLPDTTNFNPESFGLPPLQFSPIARSREVEKTPETPSSSGGPASVPKPPASAPLTQKQTVATVQTPSPPPMPESYTPSATRSGNAGLSTALGLGLLLIALAGGIWFWKYQKEKLALADTDNTEKTAAPLPGSGKTNELPKKAEKPLLTEEKEPIPAKEDKIAEKPAPVPEAPKKTKTTAKGGKECVLVVATLQEKANADRLEQLLKEEGFDVYYLRNSGYQVGIRFYYNKLSEIQDKMAILQNITGEENIWIKKR